MSKYSKIECLNCGKIGHSYRDCREPKTSYGIIAIHLEQNETETKSAIIKYLESINAIMTENHLLCNSEKELKKFIESKNNLKFLLIMRKHTLGYMEFIKGRYNLQNVSQIRYLFEQMTQIEKKRISDHKDDYDFLWNDLWSASNDETSPDSPTEKTVKNNVFKNPDYDTGKGNFEKLKNNTPINLINFIEKTKTLYDCPEWGFPKGRRIRRSGNESDIECAKREFMEETGYTEKDYVLFSNIHPIVENIHGSDGVRYRHIYYVAFLNSDVQPSRTTRVSQLYEIGNIGLFNVEEALGKIREHHSDRRKIVYNICSNILHNIMSENH